METASNARTAWNELPTRMHELVAELLGGPVTDAESQSNGFSPGSADRVRTADGRRAFVKSVQRGPHSGTYDLHMRELAVMQKIPSDVNTPALLGSFVSDDWVALILEDIEGAHPGSTLDGSDVVAVLDGLSTFPALPGTVDLPRASDELAVDASGWAELENDGAVGELPEWVQASFDRLRSSAETVQAAVEGEYLLHLDCRADNVLIDAAGKAWVIDWPWAGIGARWVDGLCYLLDVRLRGEDIDVETQLLRHPLFEDVPSASIDAVLAAVTGGFFAKSRRPIPPGMPTLRDFQRREAIIGMTWLQERWG